MLRRTFLSGLIALSTLAGLASLPGCTSTMEYRDVNVKRYAGPNFMIGREINTGLFNLTVYERMHERHAPAHVYIEGDGVAWTSRTRPSLNPTPIDPVGMRLASMDKAKNIAWMARPCQYSWWNGEGPCPNKYWTDQRYSAEVVEEMSAALDEMKRRWDLTEFHLVGYSGGGTIAALLAVRRDDVASFRTVAGNLDHEVFTALHEVTPMTGSLNPVEEADMLRFIPQHHFIGAEDEIIPPAIFHSYDQALQPSNCVASTFIPDAGHQYGWQDRWPELLKKPLGCTERLMPPTEPVFSPPPPEFMELRKGKSWGVR